MGRLSERGVTGIMWVVTGEARAKGVPGIIPPCIDVVVRCRVARVTLRDGVAARALICPSREERGGGGGGDGGNDDPNYTPRGCHLKFLTNGSTMVLLAFGLEFFLTLGRNRYEEENLRIEADIPLFLISKFTPF